MFAAAELQNYCRVLAEAADAACAEYRAIRIAHGRVPPLDDAYRHWQLLERRRVALAVQLRTTGHADSSDASDRHHLPV
jgi:hypothetical protein